MADETTTTGEDDGSELDERSYERGKRMAWSSLLRQAVHELGMSGRTLESLIIEREEAVAMLRDICEDHGDNDWKSDLHLADVIDKHLGRHLG